MRTDERERRALRLVHSEGGLESFCLGFDRLLRDILPYEVAAWSTHDPASGLNTSCTMSGLPKDPAREAALFRHEFAAGEPASYLSMISQGPSTAVLSEITGGEVNRASRFAHLLSGFGVTDELRAICWDGDTAWGSITLYRTGGTFSPADADTVGALAPHVATGLRLTLLRTAASRPEAVDDPPGILEVHPDGAVTPMTGPAATWLELGGQELATAARILASAIRQRPDWQGATSRLTLPDARVLSLHAASISEADGAVAVIVDRARSVQLSGLLIDAYRLTPRQRDVLGLLLLGRSTGEIAARLRISEHTANDHRKAIYAAFGVTSRAQLAAHLQTEHYLAHSTRDVPPSPYGGFLRT